MDCVMTWCKLNGNTVITGCELNRKVTIWCKMKGKTAMTGCKPNYITLSHLQGAESKLAIR